MNTAMTFPDTVDEFMEQYGMTDTECVYSNGIEYVPIYRMKQWFEHLKVKPKTNADRIRNMTDEELAHWLGWRGCECPNVWKECQIGIVDPDDDCVPCWLNWLKEEVKE